MTGAQDEARRAVDELQANGATFTYELVGDGDRRRCRSIIVKAKADPMVWTAVLAEVATRTRATS